MTLPPCPDIAKLSGQKFVDFFDSLKASRDNSKSGYLLPEEGKHWDATADCTKDCGSTSCSTNGGNNDRPTFTTGFWYMKEGGNYWFEQFNVTNTKTTQPYVLSGTVDSSCTIAARPNPEYPINIYIRDVLNLTKAKNTTTAMTFSKLKPSEFIVWFANATGDENTLTFGSQIDKTVMSLYAPNSKIDFSGNSTIMGFITTQGSANSGSKSNTTFYYDNAANTAFVVANYPKILSWKELP